MRYGQFCPIAKACEILGERWTFLIVREFLMGGRRFNELLRGLGDISPALLTKRLRSLEEQGLIVRRRASRERQYEYFPTEACEALLPLVLGLGEWGLLWARNNVIDDDLDLDLLMLYLERSVDPAKLKGRETVIRFRFTDLAEQKDWWLLVRDQAVELCIVDPGRDVNVYITCTLRTMHDVWMGDRSHREAMSSGELFVEGDPALVRNLTSWLRPSLFAEAPRKPYPAAA